MSERESACVRACVRASVHACVHVCVSQCACLQATFADPVTNVVLTDKTGVGPQHV